MKLQLYIALVAAALGSCGPGRQPEQATSNAGSPVLPAPNAPPAVTNGPTPSPPATAKTPVVDPKSTQAAMNLVQSFVAFLNRRQFDEAYMLLGPGASPRAEFDSSFSHLSNLDVTVGTPGDQEGAAGSIYLSVPLTVAGTADGKRTSHSATAVLRRVNDVPGSTEAQRHWHIERIDWGRDA